MGDKSLNPYEAPAPTRIRAPATPPPAISFWDSISPPLSASLVLYYWEQRRTEVSVESLASVPGAIDLAVDLFTMCLFAGSGLHSTYRLLRYWTWRWKNPGAQIATSIVDE